MKSLVVILVLAGMAHADTLDEVVRDRVAAQLPENLGVAKVFAPAGYDHVDAAQVAVELPREVRAGRASMKVTVRHHGTAQRTAKTLWVPVAISARVDVAVAVVALPAGRAINAGDFTVERRAVDSSCSPAPVASIVGASPVRDVAAGDPIIARDITLPRPLARGTQVSIEIHRGAVRVRGTATLELAARPGDAASARLAQTKTIVHGTLVAPATLVVGD
jgi:flagella basal body P-ring formation protein FlgA